MASELGNTIQTADWSVEKHVPVISCPETVSPDEPFDVSLELGKAVDHPNTTEHHIRWMALYFQAEGAESVYDLAKVEFNAHGESVQGADMGPAHTQHKACASVSLNKGGTLHALAYCNIHGLWGAKQEVKVNE